MGRVVVAPRLDVRAAQHAVPVVARLLDMLHDEARRRAPDGRVWVTMRDERVRKTHFDADAQTIPGNLRFKIEAPERIGQYELARHPRDTALSAGNRINCRCDDPTLPDVVRQSIHKTLPRVEGTRVSGQVYSEFPRIVESEYGTGEDEAASFMRGALAEVALRVRSGRSR